MSGTVVRATRQRAAISALLENVEEFRSAQELHDELRKRGVEIVNPPFEIDDISARLAFFRDPWGNMFELSERIDGKHVH